MFQQSTEYPCTWYAASYPSKLPERAPLSGQKTADIAIVGGGFSGLHCALRLALAGKKVLLLEASRVAFAASGRNGGQALLGWSCDMAPLAKSLGVERTRILWESMRWAAKEIRELPARHGFEVDYQPGSLWSAVMPRRVRLLQEAQEEMAEQYGYDLLRLIDKQQLPDWIGSERYQAALYDPEGGHLNPLKLAQGLASAIEAAGGRIYEQSRVISICREGDGWRLSLADGGVKSDLLILACNAYIDQLDNSVSARMLPVGNYQVATAPLDESLARSLLPQNSCVIDNQFVPDYFRLTADNRLLFGGGCTYFGGLPDDIAAATRPYLERAFPQLKGVAIEYGWGGHLDCTLRRTPDIGESGGKYWMQGFSGHGVLPTLAAARAVTEAILGDRGLLDIYQAIGNPRFPGGTLLRAPIEAAGKAWYRLRDLF
ncbi:FAD-dependent oxidoreductase [Ventosimonas gracilis]|uniref:FAD-dependent oxidoreductase n=1 Tax=Ventosimonas gracilis TaxID=1680762 RepID=A0A139SJW3_9GAMM|nr:FAD-binding oxidoreductase [Ventosimonas gracilis]KXU34826.1 FAD-dependent oxidoreductase [Ventosimonas gracilis]